MRLHAPLIVLLCWPLLPAAGQPVQPVGASAKSADEVVLDLVVRDKKGKPVTDLKPDELAVSDNGVRQTLTGFRLVNASEAVAPTGAASKLDPLRQVRLVTLVYTAMAAPEQRKLARNAGLDLVKGDQPCNVFYAVMLIHNRLLVVQPFTQNREALSQAIERVTAGLGGPRFATDSDAIAADLKRNLTAAAPDVLNAGALPARLSAVMLEMLREDPAATQGARLTISALRSAAQGLRSIPGRKAVVYFTSGMYLAPELDVPFRSLESTANRNNVAFYTMDTRGVMTSTQTGGAREQLSSAAETIAGDVNGSGMAAADPNAPFGATVKAEMKAADQAEVSARANVQEPLRILAESTGGFLIGDSNDLRVPLRHVNEEISSYYELSFNPGIQNYDGSFRKISVNANRKDLVIHARNGYFALPPEARAGGLMPFEVPLLKILSDNTASVDVKFRAGALLLQPKAEGTGVAVLVEVPLNELHPVSNKAAQDVHCSLLALVKDAKGEVVQKLSRDRSFQVTAEQLKLGHFLDKMTVTLPPGKYGLEAAVMDRESGKMGTERSEFTVPAKAAGVAISSLTPMRSYMPNAKGLDPSDPFQFQGGSITPTMDLTVKKAPNAVLRLFFTVYPEASVNGAPTVEIEFLKAGQSLTKVPMQLPAADAQGRIPYLMTVPAESIPAGSYEVRATAHQGSTAAGASTMIVIE